MTLQAAFAATLVEEWQRAGITDVVIAPGSRSTPLVLAVAASTLRVHVHLDERSAGFFALGLALRSGRAAPVITTSGSAPAHLLPAVIEAHHASVPMIVCTADRPPELHDVGAPQTVDQTRLYDGFVRWQSSPGAVADLPSASWRSIASRSVAEAAHGPVHLNLAFRDPLVGVGSEDMPPGRADGRPWHTGSATTSVSSEATTTAASMMSGQPGVIVADAGISDPTAVLELGRALGWPILAGPRSQCRHRGAVVVSAFDAILRHRPTAERLRPSAVLRLGAPLASKVTNAWLAGIDAEQILVDPYGKWPDPDRVSALQVAMDPAELCRAIASRSPAPAPDGWAAAWRDAETRAQQAISGVLLRHSEVTEPGVARAVSRAAGADDTLVVASSMPIRDVEWYGDPTMLCRVLANRGANGIDGFVSTALGAAAASGGGTVALCGDLAFLHDSGGLLGSAKRGVDCVFVVVDNHGGGIFSFLPQATALEHGVFEEFFGTPQDVDLGLFAGVHGIAARVIVAGAEVEAGVRTAMDAGGVQVVLVRTDRAANVAVHDELVAAVAEALDRP